MTLINKIARALAKRSGASSIGFRYDEKREQWEGMARAALEAMREPTGGVGDAGLNAFEAWERGESDRIYPHGPIWRAMIDAALAEQPEGGRA